MTESSKPWSSLLLKFSIAAAAFCLTTLLCFLVVEAGFRIYAYQNSIDFRLYQKELKNSDRLPDEIFTDIGLKPNSQALATTSDFSVIYQINSFGYRDQEYPLAKPPGKTRILVFGDSFTFGEGVPYGERFTDIVEEKIPDLEVINFGVPGDGIDENYAIYRQVGAHFKPDYVILMANWLGAERYSSNIVQSGQVDASELKPADPTQLFHSDVIHPDDPALNFQVPLSKQSYFLSYLEYQVTLRLLKQRMKEFDAKLWTGISNSENVVEEQVDESNQAVVEEPIDPTQAIEQRTALIIQAFKQDVEENGGKFIVANIDAGYSYEPIVEQVPDLTFLNYQQQLSDLSVESKLSFTYDGHYRPQTHHKIGEWLTQDIQQILTTATN